MCAVMGPSGAGKTTLLDIISRRKTEGKLSGKNYFDGAVPSKSMVKKYTAYIQQQDCFFGGATVSETILFAAMAKLPPGDPMEEKRAKVAEVIAQLNLSRCANTYMGNRLIRGVSGGEMKRTAVACALLCSPRCMFLDEPTSGLDSAMAQEVIGNLRALQVKQGCTFVVTIHQPAPVVFDAFNRLVLLNLGRLAYWGDGRTAPLEFFAAQGFPYRPGYNVAEYLIDTLSTNDSGTGGAHDFEGYYAKSTLCEENTAVVRETVEACDSGLAVDSGIHADGKGKSKYANGFWRELWVLLRYKGLPRAKHPLFISLRVLLYILLAGLLSSFFYSQDRQLTGIFNTIGILFIAVILPCFMAQVFVEEMKFDREVYTREFNDAYYRAGTYVAARILTEIPYLFLSGGAFASVLYWCIGLNDDLERFGFFVLATFVNFAIAMLVGFTIASGIAGEVGPAVVLPIYTTLNMLVAGSSSAKPPSTQCGSGSTGSHSSSGRGPPSCSTSSRAKNTPTTAPTAAAASSHSSPPCPCPRGRPGPSSCTSSAGAPATARRFSATRCSGVSSSAAATSGNASGTRRVPSRCSSRCSTAASGTSDTRSTER